MYTSDENSCPWIYFKILFIEILPYIYESVNHEFNDKCIFLELKYSIVILLCQEVIPGFNFK